MRRLTVSWDTKALAVLTLAWAAVAIVYLTIVDMMPGARGWATGAVIFGVLTLAGWVADRRGARRFANRDADDG